MVVNWAVAVAIGAISMIAWPPLGLDEQNHLWNLKCDVVRCVCITCGFYVGCVLKQLRGIGSLLSIAVSLVVLIGVFSSVHIVNSKFYLFDDRESLRILMDIGVAGCISVLLGMAFNSMEGGLLGRALIIVPSSVFISWFLFIFSGVLSFDFPTPS